MKYRCKICGHITENKVDNCPICGAPWSQFEIIKEKNEKGDNKFMNNDNKKSEWADEHKVGVINGIDKEVLQGLKDHFMGECTEVGMYLAMGRIAAREGYPEIEHAYRQIAFEEAEHAAKFCELLGEIISTSTKENLKMRYEAEKGACQSKKHIATKAKELNYDAIHDTVHEMCKDEARHGAIFKGLLERYFNK